MPALPDVLAALLLGLLGGAHCIGMCGGIAGALAFALGPRCGAMRRHLLLLLYSGGRIASYTLMGALAGLVVPAGDGSGFSLLRGFAGVLLVLVGLALAGWARVLGLIERAGSVVWNRLQPLAVRLGPPDRAGIALAAGMLWGWLPCGLVYAALAWSGSAGTGSATASAALMLLFGLGTLPAVLASGALASVLRAQLQRRGLRLAAALSLCVFGAWTLAAALGFAHGAHVHHH